MVQSLQLCCGGAGFEQASMQNKKGEGCLEIPLPKLNMWDISALVHPFNLVGVESFCRRMDLHTPVVNTYFLSFLE